MKDSATTGWELWRKYLNDRRIELNLSEYEVAQIAGLNRSQVNRVLSGEIIPSAVTLLQIMGALQVNPVLYPKEDYPLGETGRLDFN